MSNIILPDDPEFNKPIIMGNPFEVDPTQDLNKQAITPGTKQAEMDRQRAENPHIFKYANTLPSSNPESWQNSMTKISQSTGVSNMMTQPMWFSPLHTPQNWQVASKRREVYQWSFVPDHCYLLNYGDFSLLDIQDVYTKHKNNQTMYIQNNKGEKASPDICTKRYVEKQVNTLKIMGVSHPLKVTHDHKCMIIKREHVKCTNVDSPGCLKAKCDLRRAIDYKISTVNAEDVRKGDYVLCPFSTEVKESVIKTKEQARFAGHVASDGYVSKKESGVSIFLHPDEEEFVMDSVKPIFDSYGSKANLQKDTRSKQLMSMRSGSKQLHVFASSLVKGSNIHKKYTDQVMLLDPKLQLHVLGAYIQSDGSYNKVNEQIEITTCSKHLASQLQIMFYRCGIMAFASRQPRGIKNGYKTSNSHYYMINVPKTYVYMLKDYVPGKIPENVYEPVEKSIYKDSKFRGKSNIYFKKDEHEIHRIQNRFFWKNYVVTPVVSNTCEDYKGDVYDIRTPPTFAITANGIAIHQCRFFYEGEPKVAAAIDFYCFAPETQILMANGSQKSISSIEPGDEVVSHSGKINKVAKTFVRDASEDILEIHYSGSSEILRVTYGHKILVEDNDSTKYVQAQELKVGDYLLTPINHLNLDHGSEHVKNLDGCDYIYQEIRDINHSEFVGKLYDLEIENDHSYIANGIACSNSRFPMNGFKLECTDPKILKFFAHHIVKKLHLNERFKEISSEYYMLGDVFVHTDIQCDICGGTGEDPDTGERCDHPGGKLSRIFIMNPDWIEVQRSPLTDEPLIVLIPDEELQQIVHKRQPKAIYDRIPEHLKALILSRAPIPLSNRTISHLKHMSVPYGTYGTSIIRRLFTTLAYKTKIMTANWIVAERLILPVRVVKIGSDARPAATQDIADVQQQLANVANDPNMTIVTHHNFEYDWYGTSGKVLQITQEMEHIDKELLDGLMLNQALLNGEMCHSEDTEVLTEDGFKTYDEITNEQIMCFDSTSSCIRLEPPYKLHVYDYDDELIHFLGEQLDIMVTPHHKMLVRSPHGDKWTTILAKDVKPGMRFLAHSEYQCNSYAEDRISIDETISIAPKDFFEYAGYYLSEGHMSCQKSNYQISISQLKKSSVLQTMSSCVSNMGMNFSEYDYDDRTTNSITICNKEFVQYMKENFGTHAENKKIPAWMKNYPVDYLHILLKALVDGDGHTTKHKNTENHVYTTISEELADDVQEIAFKCGYNVRKAIHVDRTKNINSKSRLLYRVKFSKGTWSKGNEPRLKEHHINKVSYKGKVWCFTTSTGFFVTRRNGKMTIQGNSGYQSAQVGVETLIRRIESWRHTLAEFAEERIFKPVAEMQGFVNEKESEEVGETVFMYPTIKWNELELKDKTQFHQLLNQLHDKQVISTQTLLEEFGFDYDQEVMRMRHEQAQAGPAGAMLGGGGGAGGMPMGGGGMPGVGSPAQGGMPGEGMDPMGGMGGMGGGMDMGGGGMPGAVAEGGKITKKGKSKASEEAEAPPMMPIKLTKIEQKMAGMLEEVASTMGFSPANIRMQFPIENPKGGKPFTMDFALPPLKIDIEADGELHMIAGHAEHDQERDYLLAQRGWTVLRFDDKVIEEAPHHVKATINSYITKAMQAPSKTASTDNDHTVGYFSYRDGSLKDLGKNAQKYYEGFETREQIHTSEPVGSRSAEEYFATARKV